MRPGDELAGRYRLVKPIGAGGMGEVWLADDVVVGREVAIKTMNISTLADPGFARRFRAEARTMATLTHPGIAAVYDHGETDDAIPISYLVMEYVDSQPLSVIQEEAGRLDPVRVMNLVAQAADALHSAHLHGVVHRDVKPSNLLIRPDDTLVLADFGIARSSSATRDRTASGTVLGTAAFLSPEQAAGEEVTPAVDIYALGIVAYLCLSGGLPFTGDVAVEVALKHLRDPLPPLPDDTPAPAREVTERALRKVPGQRWASAHDMARAARLAARGEVPPEPAPVPAPPTAAPPVPPHRSAAGSAPVTRPADPATADRAPSPGHAAAHRDGGRSHGRLPVPALIASLAAVVLIGLVGVAIATGHPSTNGKRAAGTLRHSPGSATPRSSRFDVHSGMPSEPPATKPTPSGPTTSPHPAGNQPPPTTTGGGHTTGPTGQPPQPATTTAGVDPLSYSFGGGEGYVGDWTSDELRQVSITVHDHQNGNGGWGTQVNVNTFHNGSWLGWASCFAKASQSATCTGKTVGGPGITSASLTVCTAREGAGTNSWCPDGGNSFYLNVTTSPY